MGCLSSKKQKESENYSVKEFIYPNLSNEPTYLIKLFEATKKFSVPKSRLPKHPGVNISSANRKLLESYSDIFIDMIFDDLEKYDGENFKDVEIIRDMIDYLNKYSTDGYIYFNFLTGLIIFFPEILEDSYSILISFYRKIEEILKDDDTTCNELRLFTIYARRITRDWFFREKLGDYKSRIMEKEFNKKTKLSHL